MDDDPKLLEWPENDDPELKRVFVETLSDKIGSAKWLYFTPYPTPDQSVCEQISDHFDIKISFQGRRYSLTTWAVSREDIFDASDVFFGQRFPEIFILTALKELSPDELTKAFGPNGTTCETKLLSFDDNAWTP